MATVTLNFSAAVRESTNMASAQTAQDTGSTTTGIVQANLHGDSKGHVEMDLLDSAGNNLASASGGQMAAIQAARQAARQLFPSVICTFGAGETQTPTEPARNTLTYDPIPGETGNLVITYNGRFNPNTAAFVSNSKIQGAAYGTGTATWTIPWSAA